MLKSIDTSNMPTSSQIAELHALLHQNEQLAHQINYLLTVPISYTLFALLFTQFFHRDDTSSDLIRFFLFFAFIYVAFYIYEKISSSMISIFPNGIGSPLARSSGYELQKKLGKKEEFSLAITDLKTLVNQKKSRNIISILIGIKIWLAVGAIILESFSLAEVNLANLWELTSKHRVINFFGLSFGFHHNYIENYYLRGLVSLLNKIQALYFSNYIYRQWSNFNPSQQLSEYNQRLTYISNLFSDHSWKIIEGSDRSKETLILSLKLPYKKVLFKLGKIHCPIRRDAYLAELHRVLLEIKIPVYCNSVDEIFVGFAGLTKKNAQAIQEKFKARILQIKKQDEDIPFMLKKLNNIPLRMTKIPNPWDCYHLYDNQENLNVNYYINLNNIKNGYKGFFIETLNHHQISQYISFDENIITVSGINHQQCTSIMFNIASPNFDLTFQQDYFHQVQAGTKHSHEITPKNVEKKPTTSQKITKTSPYPGRLDFGHGVVFFKAPTERKKPNNFAYPMRIHWLPEGKGYGSVDPGVFPAVANYLTKKQVLAPLENGEVHGSSKAYHTKAGAVGIQSCDEPYRNIHGQTFTRSHFKLKFDNNIRVLGHNAGTIIHAGKQYLHYRFDGPGFGH